MCERRRWKRSGLNLWTPGYLDKGIPSSGYCVSRTEVTEVQGRVGDAVPLPVPAEGIFTDLTEVPGRVLNVLQN